MYRGKRHTNRDEDYSADDSAASLLRSVKEQEAQFERLTKELEIERQSVARQLEKVNTNSETASISSISDTDDSFVWRTHIGSGIESDNESQQSSALVDSCLKVLEERGLMNTGRDDMISENYNAGGRSVTTTKTTRTVIQSSNYQANGIEDHYSPGKPMLTANSVSPRQIMDPNTSYESMRNGPAGYEIEERLSRTPSNASSVASYRSGREPLVNSQSTVVTTVAPDGSLVTTYTTRTTTVHEEPTRVTKQYIMRSSESSSPRPGDTSTSLNYETQSYNSSVAAHDYQVSSTLPRESPRTEYPKAVGSSTMPRDGYRPIATSTPEVFEEERINPDGSRTVVKKVISTTTHLVKDDSEPVVEVTISPLEMSMPSKRTEETVTETTSTRFNRNTSVTLSNRSERSELSFRSPDYADGRPESPSGSSGISDRRYEVIITTGTPKESERVEEPPPMPQPYAAKGDGRYDDGRYVDETVTRTTTTYSTESSREDRKTPTDRPPAYGAGYAVAGGAVASDDATGGEDYVTEEIVTTTTSPGVERTFDDDDVKKISLSYDDEKKIVRQDYEVDLLDLLMFLKTDDIALKSNTAGYIQHLCFNDEALKIKIRELDIIPLLVRLLDHPDEDCQRNAAGALKNLSYGRFLDDNKAAIQECGGIPACVRLLYASSFLETREYVTGVLYNLSSAQFTRMELLDESVEAVSVLIIIPLSGWERVLYLDGRPPGSVIWATSLRNAIGVLRNVSSYGPEARTRIRRQEGLIDALVWMLRAALAQDRDDMNNRVVENIVCTLRNLSYKVDLEIDREAHPDAIKIEDKTDGERGDASPRTPSKSSRPLDASPSGCLFMKKKPPTERKKFKKMTLKRNEKPKAETLQYVRPERDHPPMGVELLWEPETVNLYIYLLDKCSNAVTLEAAAGAIHNLVACQWNWAALLRAHIRREQGLPPMVDLLTQVEQEFVVRAVALALRNLAIDLRNKELIGKYAMKEMLAVLPPPSTPEGETEPSEYTICSILGTLQVITLDHLENSTNLRNHGGIPKLISLTREPDPKREKPLRTYNQRVVLDANRVLLQLWEIKEIQTVIKKEMWSHNKAAEQERAFKNATLKQPKKKGDIFAEMEEEQTAVPIQRDSRRYIKIEEDDESDDLAILKKRPEENRGGDEEFELRDIDSKPPSYKVDEEDGLTEEKPLMGEKDSNKKGKDKKKDKENGPKDDGPIYAKPDKSKKKQKGTDDEKIRLQDADDDSAADSWV